MGIPKEPKPVKLFVALLFCREELFASVEQAMRALFGATDSTSARLPWAVTDYYKKEMGSGLLRRFVSFAPLISPESLAEIKLKTQELEECYQWREDGEKGRQVNIDPGYLDEGKIVLASTKSASHRIYLRSGVYGEVTLLFHSGSYQPLDYTYPDYLWPETRSFLATLRSLYLNQLKEAR